MSRLVRAGLAGALVAAIGLAPASPAAITGPRTVAISGGADGPSTHPDVSEDGATVAFESTATTLLGPGGDGNGAVRDVFRRSLATGRVTLISRAFDGGPANGPSSDPSVSADGLRVAFVSSASNLVPGDTDGQPDVFLSTDGAPTQLISGPVADGPSSEPDLDPLGRFVAFTSSATNLVAGDTNGQPDVFLRDTMTQTTTRVSVGGGGAQATGRSSAPAVARNGTAVAFESGAANLVPGDTNGVADVFVRDLAAQRTERVSVSTGGRQQDAAIAPPFLTRPDISDDGNLVVFDSSASTLTTGDTNKRVDVFLRDRKAKTTELVSASALDVQGNNDSVTPRLAGGGGFVAFQSFASNLVAGDPAGPDVFVRDLGADTTTFAGVAADGSARGRESVPQLLQRPSLSASGRLVAFTSTAGNLAPPDANGVEDVFARRLDPGGVSVVLRPTVARPRLVLSHEGATSAVCAVGASRPFPCPLDLDVATLKSPGARLTVTAGARGVLPTKITLRLPGTVALPKARIARIAARGGLRVLRGTAPVGTVRVDVGLVQFRGGGCVQLRRRAFVRHSCKGTVLTRASGSRSWRLKLPATVRGAVLVYARATDYAGRRGPFVFRSATVR